MGKLLLVALFAAAPVFAAELSGRVVGTDGKPLKDAHVYVYTAQPKTGIGAICPSCYVDCGKQVKVDAKGNYRIKKLDDKLRFNVLAVADGHEPAFSEYRDPGPGFDFALKPRDESDEARLVRGRVVDPKGKPLVGAVVTLQAVREGKRVGYGKIPGYETLSITNAKGEFALRVPRPEALIDVRVQARNFGPRIARELLPGVPPQTIEVNVGATITGRVVDGDKPLPNVRVAFAQVDRRSAGFLGFEEIGTDAKGQFVMTGLGTEIEYQVVPKMSSLAPLAAAPKAVKTGADRSSADAGTFTTMPGFRLSGRLEAPSLPEATRVTIFSHGVDEQTVEVKSDGSFAFTGLAPGKYRLSVAARGYNPRPTDVEVKGDVADVKLALR